jgi:hypothetical protein
MAGEYSSRSRSRRQHELEERAMEKNQVVKSERFGPVIYFRISGPGKSDKVMKLIDFPEARQFHDYDCGVAAMWTVMSYYGLDVREDEIMKLAEPDEEDGTNPSGLVKAGKEHGLEGVEKKATVEWLREMLDRGVPVLMLVQAWPEDADDHDWSGWDNGHWVVAIGYDRDGRIYFMDPASPVRTWLDEDELDERWHSYGEGDEKTDHYALFFRGRKPAFGWSKFDHMD